MTRTAQRRSPAKAERDKHTSASPTTTTPALESDFEVLVGLIQRISQASTGSEALETLYARLQARYGLRALALETVSGAVTHFQPYGEMDALIETGSLKQVYGAHRVACSLRGPSGLTGHITYVFPPECSINQALLEAVTAHIALRLSQVTLAQRVEEAEDKARKRISEIATIYEIGQAIDQTEDARLLQLITDRAALLMDAQTCSLMLTDAETGRLHVAASHGLSRDAQAQEQMIGEGIAGRVVQTERSLLIVGDVRDPRLDGLNLRPEIGSSMVVPVKSPSGNVLGVLSIRRRRPAPDFTDEELKLFSVFATQAALALTNKRLYEDLKTRAAQLVKISTALSRVLRSTLDLEEVLESVANDICEVVGFARCCLFLHDPHRHAYIPRVWRNYPGTALRNPVREREGAVGAVARAKEMRVFDGREAGTDDPRRDKSYLQMRGFARSLGTDAFVAVPILSSHNDCLGVAVADNRGRRLPISPEQVSLLGAFVNQVGIAIENARLVAEMQDNFHKIQRLKSYYDNVLHSISAGILSTDARGRIELWNPAAEYILKQPSSAFRNALLPDLIRRLGLPATEREQLSEMVVRVMETGVSVHRDRFPLHPQGHAPMTLNLRLARLMDYNQERAGVVLSLEDVTQEVQLGQEIERMRRLADIGQLAAKMAHEVRNALSPIKGAAQIIRVEMETQGEGTEWPDIIIAEVDGLSHLTSAMLDFARPNPLDPRLVDIRNLLEASLQSLAAFLEEHRATVEWCLGEDLPEVLADPIQIGQVVRNLVMNAAQSMPEGGVLTVSADYDPPSRRLALRFRDTGVGIDAQEQERIFRPFVTTRAKGTGLGLPIVQKIVDHHGGRVEVESKVGEGTCFTVWLPLRPPREAGEVLPEQPPVIIAGPPNPFPDK